MGVVSQEQPSTTPLVFVLFATQTGGGSSPVTFGSGIPGWPSGQNCAVESHQLPSPQSASVSQPWLSTGESSTGEPPWISNASRRPASLIVVVAAELCGRSRLNCAGDLGAAAIGLIGYDCLPGSCGTDRQSSQCDWHVIVTDRLISA